MNAPHTATANTNTETSVGRHVLLDLYEVDDRRLCDAEALTRLLTEQLDAHGFHRLAQHGHQFPGENAGATVMVLLSESHATIHTYPEHRYAAVDVFCCGEADIDGFITAIQRELGAGRVEQVNHRRGDGTL